MRTMIKELLLVGAVAVGTAPTYGAVKVTTPHTDFLKPVPRLMHKVILRQSGKSHCREEWYTLADKCDDQFILHGRAKPHGYIDAPEHAPVSRKVSYTQMPPEPVPMPNKGKKYSGVIVYDK